ncbi:flavodoxin family protein [Humidisolicoccus flavus]|uniref:flavodoxin family protein n=1 Tax=Humidisolicoccus flavus TaxID=3111414 RepID=UPI003254D802
MTASAKPPATYDDLSAVFINTTLKKSPEVSNTQGLLDRSIALMRSQGVSVETLRFIDHDVATGVYPDMREYGWESDAWPEEIWPLIQKADILVIGGPIWLGDNSSITRKLIERLYAMSGERGENGQYVYYGKTGGAILTGNEDGVKHSAMSLLYSLQHIGYTVPPAADSGWIGEIGPGPSYLDEDSGGPENDFTNRNTTFMTWNLLHMARMLKDRGGIPAYGNVPEAWNEGERFGFDTNPEYR